MARGVSTGDDFKATWRLPRHIVLADRQLQCCWATHLGAVERPNTVVFEQTGIDRRLGAVGLHT